MANFNIAFERTKLFEGGYANDPRDSGGETYMGIARKFHPSKEIWDRIDDIKRKYPKKSWNSELKKDKTLSELIKVIYKKNYWDILLLDFMLSQSVANQVFDDAVNRGVGAALYSLSKAYQTTRRKKMTPKYMEELNEKIYQKFRYTE